jgi:hypothetical protein
VNKVNVATRVEPKLAQAVRRLAHEGNRTVSREVAETLRRHVVLERCSTREGGTGSIVNEIGLGTRRTEGGETDDPLRSTTYRS